MPLVVPDAISEEILAALIDTGGELDAAKIHLYKNDFTPSRTTVVGDFTSADFTGYAVSAVIAWGDPFVDPTLGPVVLGDLKTFLSTGPFTTANTIFGYYVTDTAGTKLLFAERFSSPRLISAAGQAIALVPQFGGVSQAG